MSSQEDITYLDDVEGVPAKSSGASRSVDDLPAEKVTTLKRQRTLFEVMKPDVKLSAPEASPPKKPRVNMSTSSGNPPLNSIPYSHSAFWDCLGDDERNLLLLEWETMGKSWLKLLKDEIRKPYFLSLKRFLRQEGLTGPDAVCQIYPPPRQIYTWSNTPLGKVKVVILGQDPYHGPNQAHGLSFSVPAGVAIPRSLSNIYAELQAEYPDFDRPKHGNLTAWSSSGVLLLNTCLTVRPGAAGSHGQKGWETFTDKVVDVVDRYGGATLSPESGGIGQGVVFLAWGSWAAQRVKKLDKKKHLILTSAHPSPLSAHKGFLGNGHFKAANEWLEKKYGASSVVDWCKL